MKIQELETYYFCTPDIDRLRDKYFSTFNEMLGIENYFNNEKLTDEEHWDKLTELADKLMNYLNNNKEIKEEFVNAYRTDSDYILGELLIQSLVADIVIKMKLDINIFMDKKSILYFEKTYPKNISIYKNKERSGSLFEYIEYFGDMISAIKSINPVELFGQEFIDECEKLVKDAEDKKKPKE